MKTVISGSLIRKSWINFKDYSSLISDDQAVCTKRNMNSRIKKFLFGIGEVEAFID